jgi:hypothetical protein
MPLNYRLGCRLFEEHALTRSRATLKPHGGVAEWFKAAVLKTAVP